MKIWFEKERNLVQAKHHKKVLRVYEVSSTFSRPGQVENVDKSGSVKVGTLLSAVDALTKQVDSLKCELREIKN